VSKYELVAIGRYPSPVFIGLAMWNNLHSWTEPVQHNL